MSKQIIMNYRITKKMNDQDSNPYFEDTRAWHVWIDICVLYDGLADIDIDRLCKYHSMTPDYYEDTLGLFCEDGYLEPIYEIVRGGVK